MGKKRKLPNWILEALSVLKPPEKLTVSEWADKYRVLDGKTSAEPGKWSTDRTPYLRGIMDAFTSPKVEEVIFCKSTQVGGTECLQNILGYIIGQDPSPTLFVYPTLDLAEFTGDNRIRPMIDLNQNISELFYKDMSKKLELQFRGMYVVLAGANSPSSLSSRPIRYLLVDERDKFPSFSGKEADPVALAKERQKTFAYNKKIMQVSTPTLKTGAIWREYESCDVKLQYYVPCPHCGKYQCLVFPQIKFNPEQSKEDIKANAYYECVSCQGIIKDFHKPSMLKCGRWQTEDGETSLAAKTGFHLNTLYSPWIRFGDIAVEFLSSKDTPELLMNFVNSWLAEPWEQTQVRLNRDKVLERTSGCEEGTVPDKTIMLTAGVDVQKDHFYYTIRAWGDRMESCNVRHGKVYSWMDIEDIMNATYITYDGEKYFVSLCAIDSGYNTDEVYEFCALNSEWAVPVKGANKRLNQKYTETAIDRDGKSYGFKLYTVDGDYYKDFISNHMEREQGEGGWFVYDDCDIDYAEQITAEQKVTIKTKGGRYADVWQPKTQGAANHYLDCEVYCTFAADRMGIRYKRFEPKQAEKPREENPENQNNNTWLKGGGGKWI